MTSVSAAVFISTSQQNPLLLIVHRVAAAGFSGIYWNRCKMAPDRRIRLTRDGTDRTRQSEVGLLDGNLTYNALCADVAGGISTGPHTF